MGKPRGLRNQHGYEMKDARGLQPGGGEITAT